MIRFVRRALFAGSLALACVGVALGLYGRSHGLELPADAQTGLAAELIALTAVIVVGAVGLLLATRVPGNPIGWLALLAAAALGVMAFARGYADLVVYGGNDWPAGDWVAWLASWAVVLAAFVVPCLVAQLFPNGRPLGGRWPPLFRLSVVLGIYLVVAPALQRGPTGAYSTVESPVGTPPWLDALLQDVVWGVSILVLLGVSLVSVGVRFRRSRGVERQQLLWLACASGIALGGMIAWFLTYGLDSVIGTVFLVVSLTGMGLMPVAVAVAILRFRLYEIDRIVSRTLTYGVLSVVLVGAYAGLVLAGQALFSSFAGGSDLAIAVSTLVVAGLFLPLRARVQRLVDRRFNRRRYDAQQTLAGFGARLRDEVDLEAVATELRRVVGDSMQPAHAGLWFRSRNDPVTVPPYKGR